MQDRSETGKQKGVLTPGLPPGRRERLLEWGRTVGLPPGVDLQLLHQALTHTSAVNEGLAEHDNERLEFLGDSVVNLLAAEYYYRLHPDLEEGWLARRRAAAVRTESLAAVARRLGIGPLLLLGHGESQAGVDRLDSVLASAFEAVAAAVYLSVPAEQARRFLCRVLTPTFAEVDAAFSRGLEGNFKSELQEKVQALLGETPVYQLVEASGPPHNRSFTVAVLVRGKVVGRGLGRTKKAAAQEAARAALNSQELAELFGSVLPPGADAAEGESATS
ncbi:MAG: ribonuclease III [Limnochordales bacterium]|nr:ribonuclease III [Limnochordales bacterium]